MRECLKAEPDAWQLDVLQAFPHQQRVALKACKGPGKSALMAVLGWNFLATRPHPKIIATSISGDNLADGLWAEMAKWQNRSEFLKEAFQWGKERIVSKQHPETWFMSARNWSKSADQQQQANTLAGIHADYVLYLVDESGGIPDAVMSAAEGGLSTGKETKIVQAGNPTHLEGPLYRACTSQRHLWFVVEITGDPDDPKRSPRISVSWAREQIEMFGRDNPWVLVNVFGQFPPRSLNTLIGPDEVKAAMARHLSEDKYNWAQPRIGVDVARFGGDRTIIAKRQGLWIPATIEMREARTNEIANRVALEKNTFGSEAEFIDGTGGYGAGVIDDLIRQGYAPMEIQFGGKASDPRFFNKRTEMWWNMVEWIKRGGVLPKSDNLMKELTEPTYTFTANGKIQLEEKEQIRKRLQFSPDEADAVALTFAWPEMPRQDSIEGLKSQFNSRVKSEYNPYDPERFDR